jgi:hypothetical protein
MNYLLSSLCSVFIASALSAQTYSVKLSGAEEVPPVNTTATGMATVTLNGNMVTVSGTYTGLTTGAIAAHIHAPARRGVNSGIAVNLPPSGGTTGTFSGSATLSAAQLQAILDGLAYLNVHSGMFPGGEIRGQIDSVPTSGRAGSPLMDISGPATAGGTLTITCPPGFPLLLVDLALPAGAVLPLPAGLACMPPSNIGLALLLGPLVFSGPTVSLTLPAGAPSFELGLQCLGLPGCLDLSVASRVAVRP